MQRAALPFERICEYSSNLSSPAEVDGALYVVAQNGDVLSLKEGQIKTEFHLGGQPSALVVDSDGKNFYLADMAHQAIIMRTLDEKGNEVVSELVKEYEGQPLLGPNSLAISESLNCLFFSDSGPFAETSIENPKGSIYMIDLDDQIIRPLALNCLSFPSGLSLSPDEKILLIFLKRFLPPSPPRPSSSTSPTSSILIIFRYVCETCRNRVIRFVLTNQGIYYFSVFKQFAGRFGPLACTVSQSNLLYVARFEFGNLSNEGVIDVLKPNGEHQQSIVLPNSPEITGLIFSNMKSSVLYVTENTTNPTCLRVQVESENEDSKEKLE